MQWLIHGEWDTQVGIECSTMAMKYLGETFDIHTGGVDPYRYIMKTKLPSLKLLLENQP